MGTEDAVRKSAISFEQKSFEMAPHSEGSVLSRMNIISSKNRAA